jgi:hypothetical protein
MPTASMAPLAQTPRRKRRLTQWVPRLPHDAGRRQQDHSTRQQSSERIFSFHAPALVWSSPTSMLNIVAGQCVLTWGDQS